MEEKYDFYKHGQLTVEVPQGKTKAIAQEVWITALGCSKKFILDSVIRNDIDATYLLVYKQEE